jgi:hypothetical protein
VRQGFSVKHYPGVANDCFPSPKSERQSWFGTIPKKLPINCETLFEAVGVGSSSYRSRRPSANQSDAIPPSCINTALRRDAALNKNGNWDMPFCYSEKRCRDRQSCKQPDVGWPAQLLQNPTQLKT